MLAEISSVYFHDHLDMQLKESLSAHFVDKYLADNRFYYCSHFMDCKDAPQRGTEDLDEFSQPCANLFASVLGPAFNIV